jgi:hypothetical protein
MGLVVYLGACPRSMVLSDQTGGQDMKIRKLIRPRWTKTEIAYLKKHYKSQSNLEIANAIGRKVSSVLFKGHRLGLSKGAARLKAMGQQNIAKRWSK